MRGNGWSWKLLINKEIKRCVRGNVLPGTTWNTKRVREGTETTTRGNDINVTTQTSTATEHK